MIHVLRCCVNYVSCVEELVYYNRDVVWMCYMVGSLLWWGVKIFFIVACVRGDRVD